MPNRFIVGGVNIFNKSFSGGKRQEKTKTLKIFLILFGFFLALIVILGSFFIQKISYPYSILVNFKTSDKKKDNSIDSRIKNFGIKIDKIKVLVPVVKNVNGVEKKAYNEELKKGVAHLKGSAFPGGGSNIFLFGHSSGFVGYGPYSKIFSRLGELEKGDKIIIFYKNREYIYFVFEKEIVEKNNLSVIRPTGEEQLTLMTCWPVGTNKKRLVIKAKPAQ